MLPGNGGIIFHFSCVMFFAVGLRWAQRIAPIEIHRATVATELGHEAPCDWCHAKEYKLLTTKKWESMGIWGFETIKQSGVETQRLPVSPQQTSRVPKTDLLYTLRKPTKQNRSRTEQNR